MGLSSVSTLAGFFEWSFSDQDFGISAQRIVAALTRSNAYGFEDFADEDLSVANFTGLGGTDDGFEGGIQIVVLHDDVDFEFREQVDGVGAAPVLVGASELAAVASYLLTTQTMNTGVF